MDDEATVDEKLEHLREMVEGLKSKLAGVLAEYSSSSAKMKQRIFRLENVSSAGKEEKEERKEKREEGGENKREEK